ncbi:DNA helicase RecQ [Leadbettera azotonutricia]|uniref:DNA helicase RecQ n=1 Tax=Leadbettera azotonutricia (strain ATCC BAA-888 / DSM 13862 / ZAS-9) TaxID=545695 RepID=F5YFZ3_LEAAZ|nr:DNA helicase RecQ [Leadbettera azotonutricia]AEF80191.1 ATP-dependent DNA helicase RecQ [Leadbettera azotonutricia ZAS-9]
MALSKHKVLEDFFGFKSFRPGQEETIDAVLAGRDVLAIMPTGAGKSLCYQIPALMLPGLTIVISPLISLMKDQVEGLKDSGVQAACLNSSISPAEYNETMDSILAGKLKLLYIAPERLQRAELPRFAAGQGIPLVVVDEAHCLSQWGHDFRQSYLDIAGFIKSIKPKPVTAAFTATATPKVREDIITLLRLKETNDDKGAFIITTGFDRPNLYFEVQKPGKNGCASKDKNTALLDCLKTRTDKSGIIYCATRKAVEEVWDLLLRRGFGVTRYHAGLGDAERKKNQDDFLYDRKPIIVATNALGMGIDKSNVSFVIHYNMPKNIESYYQEAGRAGRDGAPADCILLYSGQDVKINEFLIARSDEESNESNPDLVEHNLELLKQMTYYATGNGCLRQRLLSYFDEQSQGYCGNCSNCLTAFDEVDISLEARKIISCVYRLKQRNRAFGKVMIIDILKGSRSEKVVSQGFDTLSTWGIMREASAHRIRAILDWLVEEGYLLQSAGEYPVIEMGIKAGDFLKGSKPLMMMLAKEAPPREIPFREKAKAAEKPGAWENADAGVRTKTEESLAESSFDEALFAKLKELRRQLAAKEGFPAYIVFSDASLRDMCRKLPKTLEEFPGVSGVGQVKTGKYGLPFTSLIREHCSANAEPDEN